MNRILILLATAFLLQGINAHAQNVSAKQWQQYKTWAKAVYPERDVALAVAPNGSHCSHFGNTKVQAKNKALHCCKTSQYNPTNAACKIVDVNFKRVGTSVATTTSNSSDNGWCVTDTGISQTSKSYCVSRRGHWSWTLNGALKIENPSKNQPSTVATTTSNSSFQGDGYCAKASGFFKATKKHCDTRGGQWKSTYEAAKAEHLRLKNQPSTVATTTSNSSDNGWCVTDTGISQTSKSYCVSRRGHWSWTLNGALKIENPSKNQPSTVATTIEAVDPQPAEINQSALELEFWKTIKDSDDPDMFREYVRQFPSGTYVGLAKIKIKKLGGAATSIATASVPNLNYGNYHALVIGNNQYQNFKDLNTPINDARTVSRILRKSYGFTVDVLENATESEMFKAIVELRSNVGGNDNVLIYFGGHGELDRDTEEGFWIPSDARRDDPSTYIPVDRIRKQIKAMSAKHVMVVADSCFSGSLTRSTLTRALKVKPRSPEYQSELQRIIDKKSRTALTSGGLEPVLDSGGGGHSVFASALISALRDNSGILDAHELFIQVRKKVRNNSPQDPEYSPIYETGHDHGDFLFVKR